MNTVLQNSDIRRCKALLALLEVKADPLPFLKVFEAIDLYRTVVNKNILPLISNDKTVTFPVTEPLYCSTRHTFPPLAVLQGFFTALFLFCVFTAERLNPSGNAP